MSLIVKDCLGLGINKKIIKEKIYNDEENDNFTRQLLSIEEKEEIKKGDFLSINDIRSIIIENSIKDTYDKISHELIIIIDSRINYNIYVVEDNIYTYEELCKSFPFQEFNILPESIFNRQVIAIFENNTNSTNDSIEVFNEEDPIITTYDLVGIATGRIDDNTQIKIPKQIIKSKIFIGGDKWKNFLQLKAFFCGIVQVSKLQVENGQTPEFLKPFTSSISNHIMIESSSSDNAIIESSSSDNAIIETSPIQNNIEKDNVEQNICKNKNIYTDKDTLDILFKKFDNRISDIENKILKIENLISKLNV